MNIYHMWSNHWKQKGSKINDFKMSYPVHFSKKNANEDF